MGMAGMTDNDSAEPRLLENETIKRANKIRYTYRII